MTNYRLFIAVELPSQTQLELSKVQRTLASLRAVRWTHFRLIHLILQFLGNTPIEKIDPLSNALRENLSSISSFPLSLEKVGAFPNLKHPRIIWAGIAKNTNLAELHHLVTTATSSIGIPADKKPFNPHLTIGRVQKWARRDDFHKMDTALSRVTIGKIATFQVEHIALIRSQLTREGPVYTPLAKIPLR